MGLLALVLFAVGRYAPLFDGRAVLEIDRIVGEDVARGAAVRRVVLVSIDGLAPRILAKVSTPTIDRLAEEGVSVDGVVTVVPSITMTSHASMLSGLSPEEHGVFFNRFEPWREIRIPTIFTLCRRAGLRCGLFAGKVKFVHFAEHEPGVERYQFADHSAGVFERALAYARERDPDFMFVHLAEVDRTGHAEGWGSDAQKAAVRMIDAQLGTFVEQLTALPRPLQIVVTADHGGSETTHHQDTPQNREIPWILWGGAEPVEPPVVRNTLDTHTVIHQLLGQPQG